MVLDRASRQFLKRLGLRLRELRTSKGWTLEESEEHGWLDWKYLQKIESGRNITVLTLERLSKLYDIEISEIFKGL